MNEQKLIKKQLVKNMLYAFIVFAIILIIFDAIIYHQVSTYMYKSIDKELIRAMELYQNQNIVSEVKKVITKEMSLSKSFINTYTPPMVLFLIIFNIQYILMGT